MNISQVSKTNIDDRKWFLYILSDPRDHRVRYVGITFNSLQKRLDQHLYDKRKNHRTCWIQSLVKAGLKPIITCVQEGVGEGWQEVEKQQIAYYKTITDLVNATDGGEGNVGWVPSVETRLKISELKKNNKYRLGMGHTVETRKKMSEMKIGKKQKPQHVMDRVKRLSIPIICLETGKISPSINELCRVLGMVPNGSVSRSICSNRKIRGYHYQYLDKIDITKLSPIIKLQQLRLF